MDRKNPPPDYSIITQLFENLEYLSSIAHKRNFSIGLTLVLLKTLIFSIF